MGEPNRIRFPVRVGMGAFPHFVGGRRHRVGMAGDIGPAPFLVDGISVAHVQVGRPRGTSGRFGGGGQMQPDPVSVGETVLVAVVIGLGDEAERLVVGKAFNRSRTGKIGSKRRS